MFGCVLVFIVRGKRRAAGGGRTVTRTMRAGVAGKAHHSAKVWPLMLTLAALGSKRYSPTGTLPTSHLISPASGRHAVSARVRQTVRTQPAHGQHTVGTWSAHSLHMASAREQWSEDAPGWGAHAVSLWVARGLRLVVVEVRASRRVKVSVAHGDMCCGVVGDDVIAELEEPARVGRIRHLVSCKTAEGGCAVCVCWGVWCVRVCRGARWCRRHHTLRQVPRAGTSRVGVRVGPGHGGEAARHALSCAERLGGVPFVCHAARRRHGTWRQHLGGC